MIQDILTMKIERNTYVNEEKAVSEIQILINKTFLLFSHHELLMSFISNVVVQLGCCLQIPFNRHRVNNLGSLSSTPGSTKQPMELTNTALTGD